MVKRIQLTPEQAESVLPDGETIHNFATPDWNVLIGCNYARADAVNALRDAKLIEIGGEHSRAMRHGLAVRGEYGWSFFQACEEKLAALEAQLASEASA